MEDMTVLPPNFQEEMMNCELEFQSEINENNIRKLIYVYTLGMQYYNLKEKSEFENYYKNKLNKLLLDENVIKYLDTHKVDLTKKVDLNIFPKESLSEASPNKETNKIPMHRKGSRDDNDLKIRYSFDMFKKKNKFKKEEIIEYVRKKIKEVDIKLKRIDKKVSDNIVDQMAIFESNKRNKKIRKKKNSEIKEEKEKEKETEAKNEAKNEVNENDIEIMNNINKNSRRRGSSISQPKFLKEIEEYVEKNMKEMYKAIEELKQSYEGEINEAVESGFDEIAESLRSDLKFEEENLTAQYEEERIKQIELIRAKYKKN
jgi:hypothetical protein